MSIIRVSSAPLALLLVLLASPALRAQVTLDSLLPDQGTVGTLLDLRLMGDTGKGKPRVWFTRADDTANKPRKTKLKVKALTDLGGGLSSLSVSFKKTEWEARVKKKKSFVNLPPSTLLLPVTAPRCGRL